MNKTEFKFKLGDVIKDKTSQMTFQINSILEEGTYSIENLENGVVRFFNKELIEVKCVLFEKAEDKWKRLESEAIIKKHMDDRGLAEDKIEDLVTLKLVMDGVLFTWEPDNRKKVRAEIESKIQEEYDNTRNHDIYEVFQYLEKQDR